MLRPAPVGTNNIRNADTSTCSCGRASAAVESVAARRAMCGSRATSESANDALLTPHKAIASVSRGIQDQDSYREELHYEVARTVCHLDRLVADTIGRGEHLRHFHRPTLSSTGNGPQRQSKNLELGQEP